MCGSVRLARFNLGFDGEKKGYYAGLPIPVQALTIAALILNFNDPRWYSEAGSNLTLLIPIVIVLSGLMVSNIRFDALPKPTPAFIRANRGKAIAYLLGVLLIVFLQEVGLLISLAMYVSHGVGRALASLVRLLTTDSVDAEGREELSG
jgi:CDP-diacylglycerol--serine O-phosphatidyltransferase